MWWLKLEWWKAETHALCLECGGDLSCHCWSALLPFKARFTVQEKRKSFNSFTGITFTDVLAYWQRHRTGLRVRCSWSQVRTLPLPQDASACWWRPRAVTVTLGAVPKQLWLLKLRRTLALNVYAPGHKYPTTQSLQFLHGHGFKLSESPCFTRAARLSSAAAGNSAHRYMALHGKGLLLIARESWLYRAAPSCAAQRARGVAQLVTELHSLSSGHCAL